MSASLAAARKRRAGITEPVIQQQPQQVAPPANTGLTLPQVIAVVDKRLTVLEGFMKEQKNVVDNTSATNTFTPSSNTVYTEVTDNIKSEIIALAEEFNNRYELLATEIHNIKDIVLKLQSYTMDVNKTLIEERIHVLSDLGKQNITIEEELEEELDEALENI
jgi:hypothetical protein